MQVLALSLLNCAHWGDRTLDPLDVNEMLYH